jgi:hypothetical protein
MNRIATLLPVLMLLFLSMNMLQAQKSSDTYVGEMLMEVGKTAGHGGLITMNSQKLMDLMEDQTLVQQHKGSIHEIALLKKDDMYYLEARGNSNSEEIRARVRLFKIKDRLLMVQKSEIELCLAPIGCKQLGFNASGPGCFCNDMRNADAIYYAKDGELKF